ncbi:MAG: insulinase family protein [Desulfobacterales bacterium]|nr:insulinase family protein [Desulfobacterales bacterium]
MHDQTNAGNFKVGQSLHGYVVRRVEPLATISCLMVALEHRNTGARHIHIAAPDAENTFGVVLKTVPQDSTGVAHILEHTVLCGSRRYPVRDPFFSMLKRSLSTFMNAFTASDWTMYPFSTQNRKDFYNLLDVYLDAVFFPRLDRLSFQQEGHRLAIQEGEERSAPGPLQLVRRGVVYNEMKGAMSSPDQVAVRSLLHALYPSSTYRFNSGGDPEQIPELTHDGLLAFHRRHYHPSNAYFYSYGDLPLAPLLETIDDRVLRRFDRIDPKTDVLAQPRWNAPVDAVYSYPMSRSEDPTRKHQATLAWLTADITDAYSMLALSLLELILLGNTASPLRKALIESGIGSSLSDGTGFSADYRDTLFAAGLKDVEKSAREQIPALIFDTLNGLINHGIDPQLVASAIHQIEFSRKEKTNQPYPYGLKLLIGIVGPWLHGGDPARVIELDSDLDRIRSETRREAFFENQLGRWLIDNPHRVRFLLEPDPLLEEARNRREAEALQRLLQSMSEEDLQRILQDSEALDALQKAPENLSVLPTLAIEDIPPTVADEPESYVAAETAATVYDRPTGGIVYLASALGAGGLPAELHPLVPFFCYCLPKIGTAKRGYVETAQRIDLYTGGIGLSAAARTRYAETGRCLPFVALNSKCLSRNVVPMFDLVRELATEPNFSDSERLERLLSEYRAGLESMIVHNGHRLAILLASRNFSAAAGYAENWSGVHQLRFIKDLVRRRDNEDPDALGRSLARISARLFSRNNLRLAVIGEEPALSGAVTETAGLLDALPLAAANGFAVPENDGAESVPREGWATSTAVSFVAKALAVPRMQAKEAAALALLSKLFRSLYLHREIREKGGAYGGLALYNAEEGIFSLASYRDPHILQTLQVYDGLVDFIEKGAFGESDVNEAKLQVCSDIDRPDPPGPAARKAFYRKLIGLTDVERNRFKQRVLAMTKDAVLDVARSTFIGSLKKGAVAVISSKTSLEAANARLQEAPLLLYEI